MHGKSVGGLFKRPSMLSSRLLRQFIAVTEELNFGRAAVRLHMAQSPLSQAIRNLEEIVGAPLLIRTKRSVRLTAAGDVFLREARLSLKQEEQAVQAARRAHEGSLGRLGLGFVGSVGFDILPRVVRNFQKRFPDVRLDVIEMRTGDQVGKLLSHQLDVGIVRLPLPADAGLATRPIERDYFVAALPVNHRLAKRKIVDLADLRRDNFVLFSRELIPSMHTKVLSACLEAGFYPTIAYEVLQVVSAIGIVAAGAAVALLPSNLMAVKPEGMVYRPLKAPAAEIPIEAAVAWREWDENPALLSFLGMLPAWQANKT
jgi:DNA-binding transcriptional LysR family regulator